MWKYYRILGKVLSKSNATLVAALKGFFLDNLASLFYVLLSTSLLALCHEHLTLSLQNTKWKPLWELINNDYQ